MAERFASVSQDELWEKCIIKQLLNLVFAWYHELSKPRVCVICRSRRLRQITQTSTSTSTLSNNWLISGFTLALRAPLQVYVLRACAKARGGGGKFALFLLLCYHNGLLFGKRLDTILLCHRIRKYPDSPIHTLSDLLWIRCRICWMCVEGSHIRKEKVADSKISGYVWTGSKKWMHQHSKRLCELLLYLKLSNILTVRRGQHRMLRDY